MAPSTIRWLLAPLPLAIACSSPDGAGTLDAGGVTGDARLADAAGDPWQPVRAALDEHEIPDVTLLVGTADGEIFRHSKGESTADTSYRIASATKWLTSATIMQLVEDGDLALSDRPQDHLDWWTSDPDDERSAVTLDLLLSFTSGLSGSPSGVPCVANPGITLENCAKAVYIGYFSYEPGAVYHYGPGHMHVAAAMAEAATGKAWVDIFADVLATPLGMSSATYVIASQSNPRPSGGVATTGADYGRFLTALVAGNILSDSRAALLTDHTDGLTIAESPMTNLELPWHYALGQWLECDGTTADCAAAAVSSSPGATGFYPWVDHERGYWAVLATELPLDQTPRPTERTVPLGQTLQPLIQAALAASP